MGRQDIEIPTTQLPVPQDFGLGTPLPRNTNTQKLGEIAREHILVPRIMNGRDHECVFSLAKHNILRQVGLAFGQ